MSWASTANIRSPKARRDRLSLEAPQVQPELRVQPGRRAQPVPLEPRYRPSIAGHFRGNSFAGRALVQPGASTKGRTPAESIAVEGDG
jgi:hypothetical protein